MIDWTAQVTEGGGLRRSRHPLKRDVNGVNLNSAKNKFENRNFVLFVALRKIQEEKINLFPDSGWGSYPYPFNATAA